MVTMFEDAYKQQPGNEELGAQTFFANVRAAQWKSAQQVRPHPSAFFTSLWSYARRADAFSFRIGGLCQLVSDDLDLGRDKNA